MRKITVGNLDRALGKLCNLCGTRVNLGDEVFPFADGSWRHIHCQNLPKTPRKATNERPGFAGHTARKDGHVCKKEARKS